MSMRGRQTASPIESLRYDSSSAEIVFSIVRTFATSALLMIRVIRCPFEGCGQPLAFSIRLYRSMIDLGVLTASRTSLRTASPSMGLRSSKFIFSRSLLNSASFMVNMNADLRACARSAGMPGGAMKGRDIANGSSAKAMRASVSGSGASSRPVGTSRRRG